MHFGAQFLTTIRSHRARPAVIYNDLVKDDFPVPAVRNSSPPAGFMNPSRPLIRVYQPLTRMPTRVPMVFAPANAVYQSTAFAEGGDEGLRRSASKPASKPANRPASTPAMRPASSVPDDGRPHFEVSNKIRHFELSRPRRLSGRPRWISSRSRRLSDHPRRLSGRPRRLSGQTQTVEFVGPRVPLYLKIPCFTRVSARVPVVSFSIWRPSVNTRKQRASFWSITTAQVSLQQFSPRRLSGPKLS